MAENPANSDVTATTPTLAEAVASVAEDLDGVEGSFDSITIQQVSPNQYVYRAFPTGGGDYEAGSVTLA